jgi:hypothetical protein
VVFFNTVVCGRVSLSDNGIGLLQSPASFTALAANGMAGQLAISTNWPRPSEAACDRRSVQLKESASVSQNAFLAVGSVRATGRSVRLFPFAQTRLRCVAAWRLSCSRSVTATPPLSYKHLFEHACGAVVCFRPDSVYAKSMADRMRP